MQRSFPKNLDSLEPLFTFVGDFAGRNRLEEGVVFAVNLAVEELFTNMVKYGGGADAVSVDLDVRGRELVVLLVHPGADEFDPTSAGEVDTDRSLDERVPGGIGLHLVRRVMDTVTYEHRDGAAQIRLTKHLGGS
ncbi:MAG TPA: ATP-binding protein [Candidatus Krumholzibacteria bacterium]|nr:ATP-binding protein [Candidatus Krumholzibacteria bacterium]